MGSKVCRPFIRNKMNIDKDLIRGDPIRKQQKGRECLKYLEKNEYIPQHGANQRTD